MSGESILGAWSKDVAPLAAEYAAGEPFPLLLIDGFLEESFAEQLLSEFPSIDGMAHSKDYVFGDKREEADFAKAGPASQAYYDYLLSDEFAQIVSTITGRTLFMDPSFHGGGFHQGGDGSHLDTHVDFNIHPKHKDWLRVLNVLLYMNKDWKPEWDGALLVRTDPKNEPRAIAPLFNRGVLMLTSDNTYHGYRKMSLPPGVTRKSVAGYAYELIDETSVKARTTSWAPEDGGVLKKSLAKHWTSLSAAKNKITGGGH
jgi:Rps23 Pro-64 3,4-dihydroxylase Tpa1-like proline 4-hydroxylase